MKLEASTRSLVVAMMALSIATSFALGCSNGASREEAALPSFDEIGAVLHGGGQLIELARFEAGIGRDTAEEIGLTRAMNGFGLPDRTEVRELLRVESTQGKYSGYADGQGQPRNLRDRTTWPIQDRNVWVVVVHNLPVSIRYGSPGHPVDWSEVPPVRFTMAIDAQTGRFLNAQTRGAGPISEEWDPVLERLRNQMSGTTEGQSTPTASP